MLNFDNFLKYFAADIGGLWDNFCSIFVSFFNFVINLFNFGARVDNIKKFASEFSTVDWIFVIIVEILLLALIVTIVILLVKLLRKAFRFRIPVKKYDEMAKQVKNLQRDLIRANYEKDKLLALKVADLGITPEQASEELFKSLYDENGNAIDPELSQLENPNRNTMSSPCINPADSRFFRLTEVDNFYKTQYVKPEYDNSISLSDFCEHFRNFAAAELGLYYDINMIRYFISSFGATRIVILQGISGTGKTSLPYAFGKFVNRDATVVSVQPAWRERTELYGYFNEFTKKYTETDFLRSVYESNFFRDPNVIILDEMNIARVEYYFAEMLSILEMPLQSEWKIDVVAAMWDNDPCLINNGKIQIPNNNWFIGTINNDDSTFAVADKVYDRAIPIDLDSRAEAFEAPDTPTIHISTDHLNALFDDAKAKYPVSPDVLKKLETMNSYLIKNFRLAFGNRVMKQLRDYVPCFIACGGTEIEAVDFIVAKKVLRKFESLSLGFMKDELTKFNTFLDKTFGKNTMKICKEYVDYLKKTN